MNSNSKLMVVAKIVDGNCIDKIVGYRFKSIYDSSFINYRLNDARKLMGKEAPERVDLPNMYYYNGDICDEIEYMSLTGREEYITKEMVNRVKEITGVEYSIYKLSDTDMKKYKHTVKRIIDTKSSGESALTALEDIAYECGIDVELYINIEGDALGIDYELVRLFNCLKWRLGVDVKKNLCYILDSTATKLEVPIREEAISDRYKMKMILIEDFRVIKDRVPKDEDGCNDSTIGYY